MEQTDPLPEQPLRYESFILRLRWVEVGAAARCHVMLRATTGGETVYFAGLDELVAFLLARAQRAGQQNE